MLLSIVACTPDPADKPAPAPAVTAVVLTPVAPTTDDTLRATATLDGPADTALTYAWTVDGTPVGADTSTLDGATWFAKGQTVAVTVAASGGSAQASVRIANTPPVVSVVPSAPSAPALTPIGCAPTATDADADPVTVTVSWTVDGAPGPTGATLTPDRTGTWTCTATADDGEATTTAQADILVTAVDLATLNPWAEPDTWVDPPVFTAGDPVTVHYRGALTGSLTLRYGVDGWVRAPELPQLHETDSHGQTRYWSEAPMTEVSPGEWTATVTTLVGSTAFDATVSDNLTEDDNAGQEWHASTTFPYIPPYLSWDDTCAPADCVIVSWMSATPELGVVEFGETEALGRYAVGDSIATRHHVALPDLPGGTRIYYRVWDALGHASELHHLDTLAAGEDSFTFLVAADMQDNAATTDRWPEVADAMAAHAAGARFLLAPGDLTSTDRAGHWWRYFEGGRPLFSDLPMLPVPGNHDTRVTDEAADFSSFTDWFALPGAERYYTLDYGTVRLLGFDTESDTELLYGGEQYTWAASVLTTPDPGWVFGYQHYGPFTVNIIPPNGTLDLQTITGLFDGHLDWFFSGHDHLNERFSPLREEGQLAPSGAYGRGEADGVGFMVVPSAGDHIWNMILRAADDEDDLLGKVAFPAFDPERGLADGEHGWVQVDVTPTALHLTTWAMGTPEAPKDPYIADEAWVNREP